MSVNKKVIERIRSSVLAMNQQLSNKFHPADVEKLKVNDWAIERFVLVTKTEDAALKMLVKCLEWRNTYGVNELTEDYFPEEMYKIGFHHDKFKDKEGRIILWSRNAVYRKSELSPLFKKFLVYSYEKVDRQTSHQGWGLIFDSTGAGLSCVDLNLSNFSNDVLQNYFPRGVKYFAIVEMPRILIAAANLIMSFMNEEMKNCVKFLKKNDLLQYMYPEYIPVHLNGSYDKGMVFIPEGVKPLEELTHTQLSAEQIKKIRLAFKNELQ